MPSAIIPSITVGLLSSLIHLPLQTATKDALGDQAARPSGTSLVKGWGHTTLFPCCGICLQLILLPGPAAGPAFALHPFLAPEVVLKKTHPIIWGFNSGAILTRLKVTTISFLRNFVLALCWCLLTKSCPFPCFEMSEFYFPYFQCYVSLCSIPFPSDLCTPLPASARDNAYCTAPKNGKEQSLRIRQVCVPMKFYGVCLVHLSCKMRTPKPISQICWHFNELR